MRRVDTSVKLQTCRERGEGGACHATNHSESLNSHCQPHCAQHQHQTKQTERQPNPGQCAVESIAPHRERHSAFPSCAEDSEDIPEGSLGPSRLCSPPFSHYLRKYSLSCILLLHVLKTHIYENSVFPRSCEMILSFCLLFTRGMALPELRVCQANILLLSCPSLQ